MSWSSWAETDFVAMQSPVITSRCLRLGFPLWSEMIDDYFLGLRSFTIHFSYRIFVNQKRSFPLQPQRTSCVQEAQKSSFKTYLFSAK